MGRRPGAPIEAKSVPRRSRPGTYPRLAGVQALSAAAEAKEREEREYQDVSSRYDEAADLADEKRGAEAIKIYDEAIAQHDNAWSLRCREVVALCYANKARVLYDLKRFAAALKTYDDLLAKFHDAADTVLQEIVARAWLDRGVILAERNQPRAAAEAFQQGIKIYPDQRRRDGILARLLEDYSDVLKKEEAKELDVNKQEGELLARDISYTGGTPSPEAAVTAALAQQLPMEEPPTPAGEPGKPRPPSALPAPEAGREVTRHDLPAAAVTVLTQPRAQSVITLLEHDPDTLIRAADEILGRADQSVPAAPEEAADNTEEIPRRDWIEAHKRGVEVPEFIEQKFAAQLADGTMHRGMFSLYKNLRRDFHSYKRSHALPDWLAAIPKKQSVEPLEPAEVRRFEREAKRTRRHQGRLAATRS